MANPLKCDLCAKPATVHLTQIVNSKIHKVDLCEACAQAKGVTDPSGFSLADLLLKASLNPEPAGDTKCESCGFTSAGFQEDRPLRLPGLLQTTSAASSSPCWRPCTRAARTPARSRSAPWPGKSLYERLTQLETELDQAIKAERYEDAARYRDEISQVRSTTGRKTGAKHED